MRKINKVIIDNWIKNKVSSKIIENPTKDEIDSFFKLLNGKTSTLLVLKGNNDTSLTIGGGSDYFIVSFSDINEATFTLISEKKKEKRKKILLVAGGQLGKFDSNICISQKQVLETINYYFENLQMSPDFTWVED